ncbi:MULTISPECIES: 50S ribosomal protein L22 [Pseudothermotoga]|jgi:large subunit ribosomal protein L22|uniref:Large ribosomal subunit protein uL22 n=1 Tax=Pseudothermotoga lettingae (strain ATCC BAA-301 / DSM 14385 / NBRC 107922 / TMO) TaxID=416591 RepID=RL22_PSELT|nr:MULTISPECIES: 50S ribosomal protein L22 [Pseudothermotoga]A8F4R6.1 RecName: Full=Large ribosomal subunit protein uL22; AltName: Full=50S ribosomal protein L22 [Pseudothermotoga lettingae TMO]MDK2884156.1 large subunit ribosomal protein [Pseudothermotoga sp.]ABV33150.1 ribosomal protein L22 [Pseudothermotoga lettingae TMO]HBJ81476.1 50S ribosomal protein L22 [Pseudothermotoga sp.]HBT26388.1 50S ribosomal protein L22 [Pseudothermotoga sp.]
MVSENEKTRRPKRSIQHRQNKDENNIEIKAVAKFLRASPRKVRSVANTIRGKSVSEAFQVLEMSPKKAARLIEKVLRSAVANAENNANLSSDSLYISRCFVDDGPRYKRIWPRGRGRADIIQRRMCHVTVAVKSIEAKS